jgi:hypothetical protein
MLNLDHQIIKGKKTKNMFFNNSLKLQTRDLKWLCILKMISKDDFQARPSWCRGWDACRTHRFPSAASPTHTPQSSSRDPGILNTNILGIRDILVRIRIRTSDLWIRIRLRLRIRLLFSLFIRMQNKIFFFIFFSYNLHTGTSSSD